MGEIHCHRGGFGAAGRRQAAAGERQLGAAGVDLPATRGDRTESPRGLRREPRATPRTGIRRPRWQIHAGAGRHPPKAEFDAVEDPQGGDDNL